MKSGTQTLVINTSKGNERSVEPKTHITELTLKLPKKVTWTEDTIDNENMNKRKSKSKLSFLNLIFLFSLLHFQKTNFKSR